MLNVQTDKKTGPRKLNLLKIGITLFVALLLIAVMFNYIIKISVAGEVEESLQVIASEYGLQIDYAEIEANPIFKTLTIEDIEISGKENSSSVFAEDVIWEIGEVHIDDFWGFHPVLGGEFADISPGFYSGNITIKEQNFINGQKAEIKAESVEIAADFYYSEEHREYLPVIFEKDWDFEDFDEKEREEFATKIKKLLTSAFSEDSSGSIQLEGFEARGDQDIFFALEEINLNSELTAERNLYSPLGWGVSLEGLKLGENNGEQVTLDTIEYSSDFVITGELMDLIYVSLTDFYESENLDKDTGEEVLDSFFQILLEEDSSRKFSLNGFKFVDDEGLSLEIGATDIESKIKPEEMGAFTENKFVLKEFLIREKEEKFSVENVSYSLDYLIKDEFLEIVKDSFIDNLYYSTADPFQEMDSFPEEELSIFQEDFQTEFLVQGVELSGIPDFDLGLEELVLEAEVFPDGEEFALILNANQGQFGQAYEIGTYSFEEFSLELSFGPDLYELDEDTIPSGRLAFSVRDFRPHFSGNLEQEINLTLFLMGLPLAVNELYVENLTQDVEYRENQLRNITEIDSSLLDVSFYFQGETSSDYISDLEQAWVEEIKFRIGDLSPNLEPVLWEILALSNLYFEEEDGVWIIKGSEIEFQEIF